jgi:general secretion pathway protein A
MYNSYFGFSNPPFENSLDQRFLFFSANHSDVTAALLYFIQWEKEFALVCGERGTGKTLLVHYLLSRLPDSVHPIIIADPGVGWMEILQSAARILNIDDPGESEHDLVDHVKAALVESGRQAERFVLIVDEAHLFSDTRIGEIIRLSSIETPEHKLFQILFLGQGVFSDRLNRPALCQLRQQININRILAPMDAAETIQYIDHRLNKAGSSFDACFEPECRHLIFKMTGGVPRSINQLCDSALRVCMTEKLLKVDRKILKQIGRDQRSDFRFTSGSHAGRSRLSSLKTTPLAAVLSASVVICILLGVFVYQERLEERARYFLRGTETSMAVIPAAVQPPGSETAADPAMTPAVMNTDAIDASKLADPTIDAESENDSAISTLLPAGADLPEMKQTLPHQVPASPVEKTGNVVVFPLMRMKGFPTGNPSSRLSRPKSVVVKKGDTLIKIASRYFPDNQVEGVNKILAANPEIDVLNRIYIGQKLIIPEKANDR